MPTKGCLGLFKFCLDLDLIVSVKSECVETRPFLIFANNARSKQNKENSTHAFVGIGK